VFNEPVLQDFVRGLASYPHAVQLLSPYAFQLEPTGNIAEGARYRVVVERAAFMIRASVVLDRMAIALRGAITSGARRNSERVARLDADLRDLGWSPRIQIDEDEFLLGAFTNVVIGQDALQLQESSARVAVVLSELVLDQLVVIRRPGEMRPATLRQTVETTDTNEPWLYDPSELDRATREHRALENWLITSLIEAGAAPLDPAGEPQFDLAWTKGSALVVCEVKTTSVVNETKQLRLGIGQVLHYRHVLRRALPISAVTAALLVSAAPAERDWLDICGQLSIVLFWPDRWSTVGADLVG
jgi:hypothetical protein